jgi:hypothetical protein
LKDFHPGVRDDAEGTTAMPDLDAEAWRASNFIVTGGGLSPDVLNWLDCNKLAECPRVDGIQTD